MKKIIAMLILSFIAVNSQANQIFYIIKGEAPVSQTVRAVGVATTLGGVACAVLAQRDLAAALLVVAGTGMIIASPYLDKRSDIQKIVDDGVCKLHKVLNLDARR
ncbi:MAG: hypothetical protein ACOYT8_01370 [Candidatus Dependentiae bacterium]